MVFISGSFLSEISIFPKIFQVMYNGSILITMFCINMATWLKNGYHLFVPTEIFHWRLVTPEELWFLGKEFMKFCADYLKRATIIT